MIKVNLDMGERFKDARLEKNPHGKQRINEVSAATDVSASLISDLENNKDRNVNYRDIAKLANHYGVSTDYLITGSPLYSKDIKQNSVANYTGLSLEAVSLIHNKLKAEPAVVSLDRFDYSSDIDEVNGTVTVGRIVDNIEVSRIRVLEKLLLNPDFLSLLDELAIVEAASDKERNEKLSKSIAMAGEEFKNLDHRNRLIKIRNADRLKAKLAKFDASTLFANVINAIWPDQQA